MGKLDQPKNVELHPDAWERFERAVGVVANSPPQHRSKAKGKPRKRLAKSTRTKTRS